MNRSTDDVTLKKFVYLYIYYLLSTIYSLFNDAFSVITQTI
jgi:hypothetical protein